MAPAHLGNATLAVDVEPVLHPTAQTWPAFDSHKGTHIVNPAGVNAISDTLGGGTRLLLDDGTSLWLFDSPQVVARRLGVTVDH